MCFKQGNVSHPGLDDVEGGLRQIGESIYVKYVDEQIIHKASTIQSEDA